MLKPTKCSSILIDCLFQRHIHNMEDLDSALDELGMLSSAVSQDFRLDYLQVSTNIILLINIKVLTR